MTQDSLSPRTCKGCGSTLEQGQDKCSRCGLTHGEQHKCPFCGVVAEAVADRELRYVCPACGAARLPVVGAQAPSPKANTALATVRRAKASRAAWRLGSGLALAFGLLDMAVLLGVLAIAKVGVFGVVSGIVMALVPFAFAALAYFKAKQRTHQLHQALDEAWVHAVGQLAQITGSVRASDVIDQFSLPPSEAHALVARLGARNEVMTDVDHEGQLLLRVPSLDATSSKSSSASTGLRVDGVAAAGQDPRVALEHAEVPADDGERAAGASSAST